MVYKRRAAVNVTDLLGQSQNKLSGVAQTDRSPKAASSTAARDWSAEVLLPSAWSGSGPKPCVPSGRGRKLWHRQGGTSAVPAGPAGEVPLQAGHRGGDKGVDLAHGRAEGRVRLPCTVAPRRAELGIRPVACTVNGGQKWWH